MEKYDVLIIGGGLTGLAAARRCSLKGLSTVVVADSPGSLPHTSGAIDLLAVFPTETKRNRNRPWEALSELIEQSPDHPYARVGIRSIMESISDFTNYLGSSRLEYYKRDKENINIITSAGTVKPTYCVPGSMRANVDALERRLPTLILGFTGLVDFSPEQVAGNLRDRWPGIRAGRLDLKDILDQNIRMSIPRLVQEFSRPRFREKFAELAMPIIGQAKYLGLPAVLGTGEVAEILQDLQQRLSVKIFEIPSMSPSPPGDRLASLLRKDLESSGVELWAGAPIAKLDFKKNTITAIRTGRERSQKIDARHVILATGRFFGGGLVADRKKVREPLVGIPIQSPTCRDDWHMNTFLGAPGHPINRVGVNIDGAMRPVSEDFSVLYDNLFAAGAILANHDWVREKSGAGISIATGYAAVDSILEHSHSGRMGAGT